MPLVGLVRLRRALGGEIPPFDPIKIQYVGRHGNGTQKEMFV